MAISGQFQPVSGEKSITDQIESDQRIDGKRPSRRNGS
jgi:hypothetical protein